MLQASAGSMKAAVKTSSQSATALTEKTESVGWDTLAEQADLNNVDPTEYPAPGDKQTGVSISSGSNGEENKENHDDSSQRTPNSRKRGNK